MWLPPFSGIIVKFDPYSLFFWRLSSLDQNIWSFSQFFIYNNAQIIELPKKSKIGIQLRVLNDDKQ